MPSSFLEQHERALAESAYDAYLLRLKSTLRLGAVTWLLLVALDAFAFRMSTRATFADFLLVRCIGSGLTALGFVVLDRMKRPPRLVARIIDLSAFALPGLFLGVLCAWLGGLKSPYVGGLSLVVSCRSVLMRERWFVNVLSVLPSVGAFVVTFLLLEHHAGTLEAQLNDDVAVGCFLTHVGISLFVVAFAAFGGDALWRLERAAFEGRSLGRFKLEARIGVGAMGEIWSAFDRVIKRNVALKVLRREASQLTTSHARFEREIKAMATMSHPNVVQILDYGVTGDNVVYFAMDLLEGKDLAGLVATTGPLEPVRAITLVEQAARALAHAHARGIVHRDVKPSNLFVCDSGGESEHVKLLDFGIAKLEDEVRHITMSEAFVGTPHYVAPEMIVGRGASFAADIYSLGAVAFFALTGAPPFDALSRSGILDAHLAKSAPRVEDLRPSVSPEIGDIVARALAKNPDDRYLSARAMAEALRHVLWKMRGEALVGHAEWDDAAPLRSPRPCDTETLDEPMPRPPGWKGSLGAVKEA